MKKLLIICMTALIIMLVACDNRFLSEAEKDEVKAVFIKSEEIKELEETLFELTKEKIEKELEEKIDKSNFNIHYSEMVEKDSFQRIQSTDTKNDIYITGSYKKGKPENIIEFTLIYDNDHKNIKEVKVVTMDDKEPIILK